MRSVGLILWVLGSLTWPPFRWNLRMELEGKPDRFHWVFLLELFDPHEADVAPGSDVVRDDVDGNGGDVAGSHG